MKSKKVIIMALEGYELNRLFFAQDQDDAEHWINFHGEPNVDYVILPIYYQKDTVNI